MEMNKWYKEGLISPDFFTQTQANGNASMAAGDGMIIPTAWYGYPAEWSVKYPDQDWVLVPGIENSNYGKAWTYSHGSADDVRVLPNWCVLVNAKSKVVDDLLKFMDYQMSDSVKNILTWGVEGQTYTVADGVNHFRDAILADPNTELSKFGLGTGSCRSGIFPQIQDYNTKLETALSEKFQVGGQIITSNVPSFVKDNYNVDQAVPGSTVLLNAKSADDAEEYANIMTPINTYAAEQMAAFISGSRSFDEWDAYVKEINDMGDLKRAMEISNSTIAGKKK
ncbi:MAG TPA: hypothetical protein VN258_03275 [Mobilitalea sp.]|nr:hypothetical protein [Mobilitalea sp.]